MPINTKLTAVHQRSAHLQWTSYLFDQRCEEAMADLLKGEAKITIATLEDYERRLEYASVCGCVGYPR